MAGWKLSGPSRPAGAAAARVALLLALAVFYSFAASEHAARVNTFKARGDQSGYLYDAQVLYRNWHGDGPDRLVDRNRMPLYSGVLALSWDPGISDDEFFVRAKRLNIALSIALLAVLAAVFSRFLPPLGWMNLTVFVAFGYFVFKAGYVQSELLFYFLFFLAFLACCLLFRARRPAATLALAAGAGLLLGLAHLTKAAMLPFLGVFLIAYYGAEALRSVSRRGRSSSREGSRQALIRFAAGAVVAVSFLAVLAPYLLNSKRVFGHYFYNVNSTFYVWYDNWPQASVGTYSHGDHVGWPQMPAADLPGPARYWREHSLRVIGARVAGGVADMFVRSYRTLWFLEYLVVFFGLTLWLVLARRGAFAGEVRANPGLFAFLCLYAVTYFLLTAFYNPTSGTGTTRFLLAHVAPATFVCSRLASLPAFSGTSTSVGGVTVTATHVQLLVSALLGLDVVFTIWPRLMTTYGGF